MDVIDGIDDLQVQVEALEGSLGDAASMAQGFQTELHRMRSALDETGKGMQSLETGLSRGLRRAFDGVVLDGQKLSDALRGVAQSMINTAYSAAVKPVTDQMGGALAQGLGAVFSSVMPFANGGALSQGRVMPFANGGVVRGPVQFPMRGGTGLMGEAGPEAIMPLTRGADGRLGVRSDGGRPVNVVMQITTPDVDGFQRSQAQVAAQVGRAIARGQRNR